MTADLVLRWLRAGDLHLPLPGSGRTAESWRRLSKLTEIDVVAGRLAEAHTDAIAILAELNGPRPDPDECARVAPAEAPYAIVTARGSGYSLVLNGTKAWCSGAGLCTHALVTAQLSGGRRGLFAVDRSGARPKDRIWRNGGMADSDTRSVQFDSAAAIPVGQPDDYLNRPGFWFGAIGVAACWLGGARAVAAPLYERAAGGSVDDHALAHLGAVDAAIAAAEAALTVAAEHVDADPGN